MNSEKRLVGGDHVLAIGNSLHHNLLGHAIAADQFDNDVDFRIVDHRERIVGNPRDPARDLPGEVDILVCHRGDLNRTAGTAGNFFCVTLENGPGATADGADADKANIDRFHGCLLTFLGWCCDVCDNFRGSGQCALWPP